MNNLIEDKINPQKLDKIRKQVNSEKKKFSISKFFFSIFLVITVISISVFYTSSNQKAEAVQFGLGNDYEKILELNSELANNVPLSIDAISSSQMKGDKRVVALLIFLERYKSPMAKASVAKAFIEGADANGFGDKWFILPAISGMESGFGRMIPATGNVSSYNGWGWSGGSKYGRWSYFKSWEDAAIQVSIGISKGYSKVNLTPEKMMAIYCPPCALPQNKGIWAKTVNRYIAEMKQVLESL